MSFNDFDLKSVSTLRHNATTGKFYEIAVFNHDGGFYVLRRYGKASKAMKGGALEWGEFSTVQEALAAAKTIHASKVRGGYTGANNASFFDRLPALGGAFVRYTTTEIAGFYSACTGTGASEFVSRIGLVDASVNDTPTRAVKTAPPKPAPPRIEGWGAW